MTRLFRWIAGIFGFFLSPVLGVFVGFVLAFGYTYVFLDADRTGNADVATNMSFLGIAYILGAIGFVAGLVGGIKILAWTLNSTMDGSPKSVGLLGDVDR